MGTEITEASPNIEALPTSDELSKESATPPAESAAVEASAAPAESVSSGQKENSTRTARAELQKNFEERGGIAAPTNPSQLPDGPRVDVSAATVARMMGIASTSDLRVLEGRIDLLTSKVTAILAKVDRSLSMFSSVPTASDIGRLEVQVAAIKAMLRELLDSAGSPVDPAKDQAERELAREQGRQLRQGIKTNSDS